MATATLDHEVEQFTKTSHQLFIDGQWVDPAWGETFKTPNPATGESLATVAAGGPEDIDRAVRAARAAFEGGPWSRMTPSQRGRIVWRIGDLILEHLEELAQIESLDNGKPVAVARAADVPLSADMFHYMAGWATKLEGDTISLSVPYTPGAEYHTYTLREPVGVVGQIIPWNFPLLMAAWKLAPALATGNCIVLKPAEQTPLSALLLARLIQEAGVPDGVVNVVTGFGETAGAPLAAHEGVDKVAFTGSTEVGKLIVQAAAGNLKKVKLELGGKSPQVVSADADPETAIPGAANAIFFNHGQCCCAGSRVLVEKSRFDEVVNGVADYAKNIKLGTGLDEDTQMGPLVSDEQLRRVTGYLDSGRADGAEVVTGGGRIGDRGYFRRADGHHQDQTGYENRPGGDLRPGRGRRAVPVSRRRRSGRQRHPLWPGCRRVDQGHLQGSPHGQAAPGRDGVDQLLQHLRRRPPLRWLQAIRMGPGDGPRDPGGLHRGQGGLRPTVSTPLHRSVGPTAALNRVGRVRPSDSVLAGVSGLSP